MMTKNQTDALLILLGRIVSHLGDVTDCEGLLKHLHAFESSLSLAEGEQGKGELSASPKDAGELKPVSCETKPLATPIALGDYVLATKYQDGDPQDHWAIGYYAGLTSPKYDPPRFDVVDYHGLNFRGNGFRRMEKITASRGDWMLRNKEHIGSSGLSVWHFAQCALNDEKSKPAETAGKPPVSLESAEKTPSAAPVETGKAREWWIVERGYGSGCLVDAFFTKEDANWFAHRKGGAIIHVGETDELARLRKECEHSHRGYVAAMKQVEELKSSAARSVEVSGEDRKVIEQEVNDMEEAGCVATYRSILDVLRRLLSQLKPN